MHPARWKIKFIRWSICGLILFIALWFSVYPPVAHAQQPTPPPYDPAAVPTPAALPPTGLAATSYSQNCAPCHGETGNSDGPTTPNLPAPPPKFADPQSSWTRSPAEYFHIAKFGNLPKLMPPWGNRLNDEQIWQAVYYAWSLHTTQQQVQEGATLYGQSCAACHGPGGAGDGPQAKTDLTDFTDARVMQVLSPAQLNEGWQKAHPEQGAAWTEAQKRNVLDYLRTFSYTPPWESAYRPGQGSLQGEVQQQTPAGGAVAQLPITLTAYIDFMPVKSFTTTTDANGAFHLEQLATDDGVVYFAETKYAGVRYGSELLTLTPVTPTLQIALTVYETTTNGSGVRINRANWIIDSEPGALLVGSILVFGNQADRTYIGQPLVSNTDGLTHTLTGMTPILTGDVQVDNGTLGGRYHNVGDRIYDSEAIPPGSNTQQMVVRYRVPYSGTEATLNLSMLYAVDQLNLLVADLPGLTVEAPALHFVGDQPLQGVNFKLWNTTSLVSNTVTNTVRLTLRNLIPAGGTDPRTVPAANAPVGPNSAVDPTAMPSEPPLEPLVALALGGALTLILAVGALWPLLTRRTVARPVALAAEKATLIQHIAELDDEHALGKLDAATWTRERAQQKGQLLAIARELSGMS